MSDGGTVQSAKRQIKSFAPFDVQTQRAIARITFAESDCPVLIVGEHGVGKALDCRSNPATRNRTGRAASLRKFTALMQILRLCCPLYPPRELFIWRRLGTSAFLLPRALIISNYFNLPAIRAQRKPPPLWYEPRTFGGSQSLAHERRFLLYGASAVTLQNFAPALQEVGDTLDHRGSLDAVLKAVRPSQAGSSRGDCRVSDGAHVARKICRNFRPQSKTFVAIGDQRSIFFHSPRSRHRRREVIRMGIAGRCH